MILGLMLILSGLFYAVVIIYAGSHLVEIHGRAILLNRFLLPFTIIIGTILLGVLILVHRLIHWKDGVFLDQDRLIFRSGFVGKVCLWQEVCRLDTRITHVKFGSSEIANKIKIIIKFNNQQKVILKNHYERMTVLIQAVREKCLPILIEKGKQQLESGKQISFHKKIHANDQGLVINNVQYSWGQLAKPVIKNNKIRFFLLEGESSSTLASIGLNNIKNLDLLLFLCQNLPG